MNDIWIIKTQQRALIREKIEGISPAERAEKSAAICRALKDHVAVQQADCILSYCAMPTEVDLSELHAALLAEGKQLAFPRVTDAYTMEAFLPADADAFVTGAFGIAEPDPARATMLSPAQMDLILLPCLAFDRQGHRLGHGKGFYDRYLARCKSEVTSILVAFDVQELPAVAVDAHDISADIIVTNA